MTRRDERIERAVQVLLATERGRPEGTDPELWAHTQVHAVLAAAEEPSEYSVLGIEDGCITYYATRPRSLSEAVEEAQEGGRRVELVSPEEAEARWRSTTHEPIQRPELSTREGH